MNKYFIFWKTTEPNAKEQRLFLNLPNRDDIQGAVAKHVKMDYDSIEIMSSRQVNAEVIPEPMKAKTNAEIVAAPERSYLESKVIR
jgi:hypothetical protein